MAKETSLAPVVVADTAIAVAAKHESFINEFDIPQDKLIIPRISLLQALSDAVQERGEKQGTFSNTVTGENYGETINLIPVKPSFGALYIVQGEGLKCKSSDGITNMHGTKCAQCPFGVNYKDWKDGQPPKCQETIDVLCIDADNFMPAILTFKSTNYKSGQRFITQLRMARAAMAYRMGAMKEKNDKGIFYTMAPKAVTPLTDEQYQAAMKWKSQLATSAYEASEE